MKPKARWRYKMTPGFLGQHASMVCSQMETSSMKVVREVRETPLPPSPSFEYESSKPSALCQLRLETRHNFRHESATRSKKLYAKFRALEARSCSSAITSRRVPSQLQAEDRRAKSQPADRSPGALGANFFGWEIRFPC